MKTLLLKDTEKDIEQAGRILREGGLAAIPTETVYGLGGNALDPGAAAKIFKAKGRPQDNPLIVHVSSPDEVGPLVREIPEKARLLMEHFWPGPLTVIMEKSALIPYEVSGGLDTVAVRMPGNRIARDIIRAAGVPIAAPSANTSGLPSPTCARHVMEDMDGKIDAVLDGGDCTYGVESTVITVVSSVPRLLRPGGVTLEAMEAVIGKIDVDPAVLSKLEETAVAASPGMKYKHYSPKADIVIVKGDFDRYFRYVQTHKEDGVFCLCFDGEEKKLPVDCVSYGAQGDSLAQAHGLFAALRRLDALGAKKVFARCPATAGVGMAVYNRLVRAAAFQIVDLNARLVIGLTGPTGSGKSYICDIFRARGFYVSDCDEIYKNYVSKDPAVLRRIQDCFGDDTVRDGVLDRGILAVRAFVNENTRSQLNEITHPAVLEKVQKDIEFAAQKGYTKFIIDIPLLFESGAEKICDATVSVLCAPETRKIRIMGRDGITADQAQMRMDAQHDGEYYASRSDYVIVNDGERDAAEQVVKILEELL